MRTLSPMKDGNGHRFKKEDMEESESSDENHKCTLNSYDDTLAANEEAGDAEW